MKRLFLNLLLILLLPSFSGAQLIDITDSTIKHDKAERPCITVALEAGPKALKGAWQDFIKDEYGVKLRGFGFLANRDLLEAEKVLIEPISDKEMNFYAHFDEQKDKTRMSVFASLGYDIYLNPGDYPREYRAMRGIVDKFAGEYVPRYYQQQVEESEELVSSLEKEIKNLENDISSNEKEIEKNLKEIDKLKKENIDLSSSLSEKEKRLREVQNLLKEKQKKLKTAKKELQ